VQLTEKIIASRSSAVWLNHHLARIKGAGGEMDRETIMDNFVEAVRQVDISEQKVAEQRRIVDLLTEFGRDTTAARKELMVLEQIHARNLGRRDQLRALLEE
jgi:hypothetical protein